MLIRRSLVALLVAVATVGMTTPDAHANPKYNYVGWAGGTLIRAVGSTITSDLTAQSYVAGIQTPRTASNNVAVVEVENILRTGAVETSESVFDHEDGVRLVSNARTANVNILDGLIRADAVTTRNVTTASPTKGINSFANTQFVNLQIGNLDLPVEIGENFTVKIPGVVKVVANGEVVTEQDGIVTSNAWGLKVVLLDALAGLGARSVIFLNPTFAGMAPAVPIDAPRLAGHAFATRAHTNASSSVKIDSGRTAHVSTPPGGTNDTVVDNSTLSVKIPRILTAGAAYSTTRGLSQPGIGEVTNTNEIAGLNLLNGTVTADVIKTMAHAKRVNNVEFTSDLDFTFVNLVVAGVEIPVDVGPNTVIKVGELARVTINKQVTSPQLVGITGIEVKLLKPVGEFPLGTIIEVSRAVAWVPPIVD